MSRCTRSSCHENCTSYWVYWDLKSYLGVLSGLKSTRMLYTSDNTECFVPLSVRVFGWPFLLLWRMPKLERRSIYVLDQCVLWSVTRLWPWRQRALFFHIILQCDCMILMKNQANIWTGKSLKSTAWKSQSSSCTMQSKSQRHLPSPSIAGTHVHCFPRVGAHSAELCLLMWRASFLTHHVMCYSNSWTF